MKIIADTIFLILRYQISDMAAAALANGLLKDFGIITRNDKEEVIDSNKVMREKKRVSGGAVQVHDTNVQSLLCIGLDGKKDKNSLG